MTWGVKEMTGGGDDTAHAGGWWGDLMTGVGHVSEQDYLGFCELVNAADDFPTGIQRNIRRWGR
jgi:hypothetical protein